MHITGPTTVIDTGGAHKAHAASGSTREIPLLRVWRRGEHLIIQHCIRVCCLASRTFTNIAYTRAQAQSPPKPVSIYPASNIGPPF